MNHFPSINRVGFSRAVLCNSSLQHSVKAHQGLDWMIFKGPFQPEPVYGSMALYVVLCLALLEFYSNDL